MGKKPLIETNPYLKIPEEYRKALIASISSSTAIETGASVESIAKKLSERDSEGYYVGSAPTFPGCHTQAKLLDELM